MVDFQRKVSFALVRDTNGVPRIDEPETLPQPIKDMLTDDDLVKMDPDIVRRLGMTERLERLK